MMTSTPSSTRTSTASRPDAAASNDPDATDVALQWTEALVTGHAGMDATHRAFVAVANELVAADDSELLARLREFEAHAKVHFGEEDALMRGTSYPSAGCHVDEHAAVLKSVADVIERVERGDVALGRDLADELVRWFPEHTHHMDKSLTAWLFKLSTGGAPLLLRRGDRAGRKPASGPGPC